MKKRVLAAIMSVLIILGVVGIPAIAALNVPVQPYWVNTKSITMNMEYSNGAVNWVVIITGNTGATTTATVTLSKQNANGTYTTVGAWPNLSSATATLAASCIGAKGTYKLSVVGMVTSSAGIAENISDSLVKTFNNETYDSDSAQAEYNEPPDAERTTNDAIQREPDVRDSIYTADGVIDNHSSPIDDPDATVKIIPQGMSGIDAKGRWAQTRVNVITGEQIWERRDPVTNKRIFLTKAEIDGITIIDLSKIKK
ncbi:MAG: hypothetical protein LBT12_00470 [Oscillospiraceae bacterium]|jgi:hypothetical protein|nr:hypothetical protein [Oscillospiraceae bacterium]